MSTAQNTASPSRPRAKQPQHPKVANQAQPQHHTRQPHRRQRGNRGQQTINGVTYHNGNSNSNGSPLLSATNALPSDTQDGALSESAILSSEEVSLPSGPRNMKKHTQSQPASDRVFSPTAIPTAYLTDSETAVNNANNPAATPAKAQGAYAGPTFHASPAPSALPIPKFLSKSVPAKTRQAPPTPPDDAISNGSGSSPTPSIPSPSRAPIPVPDRDEDSPLDLLFKADRAEKARNANLSPASVDFPYSPDQSSHGRPHHNKHNSQSSLNVMFPIELDAEGQRALKSPSAIPPVAHRSITAPSKIPQTTGPATSSSEPAIQDLLDRLSLSQKKVQTATPPKTVNRVPSEPSSRHHTPSPFHDGNSPFRSASGPTTPAPVNQDHPDFFYGNRNLSPLFKAAAKPDLSKRNSGLRTEITADSPVLPQGAFSPVQVVPQHDANSVSRNYLHQALGGPPPNARRGSAPHVPLYNDPANNYNRKPRTPGRGGAPHNRGRPDSFPYGISANKASVNGNGITAAPPKANPFVPSSVKAKNYAAPSKPSDSSSSLEQDLKRLLNINIAGPTGVR